VRRPEYTTLQPEGLDFAAAQSRRQDGDEGGEIHRRLARLVSGDVDAAAWLYDTFSPGIYRRLRRRYSWLDPDDLLQDAFIFYLQNDAKILREYLEGVPMAEMTAAGLERRLWDLACGIASNQRRAHALRDHDSLDKAAPELTERSQEHQNLARDVLERLDNCLNQGNSRVYLYYKLRYWDGHSPNEIAPLTGWSKKATYKLRQRLGEALDACASALGLTPSPPH
jgi:DNA-directed RNA polymerase specialized sigma24 family protein